MVCENVLQAIGNTPLIKINGFTNENDATIYAKAEFLNVGGSIKTRTAYNMVECAIKRGELKSDCIIVEPSSGNQGIGLALVCAVLGLKLIVIMPDSVSVERRKIIMQYGAEVRLVKDDGNIGECIKKCIRMAKNMKKNNPNVFLPNQFFNKDNPNAHELGTAQEIFKDLNGNVHGLCLGVGSGGTISGVGRALKVKNPSVQIWAVEPENSAVLSGGKSGTHIQMGIGDGIIPKVLDRKIIDRIIKVSDEKALSCAKALAKTNGLLCGISSGSNICASIQLAKLLGKGKNVVTVLPDTGERYFSTALFE